MSAARDILLVARFEVLRAVRTWQAMALFVLYTVATCGAAYLFVRLVGLMENAMARQLGVPETRVPGTMMSELVASETFLELIGGMTGSTEVAAVLVAIPVLAIFNLWFGFVLIPFFAASASAESVAVDARSRALRFELLRTGRLELVMGRFVGQLALTGVATALSVVGVWLVGMIAMVGNDPLALAGWLSWLSIRTWCFSVPFVGLGIAASQLTSSPAWARVMAVGAVVGTWLTYAVARTLESPRMAARWGWVADLALPVLPQGWMGLMWQPGGWWLGAAVCVALGPVAVCGGYLAFSRRDL